jgi:hypothetical protein
MKLTINYQTDSKGFQLHIDLEANIKEDAEGLGYILNVLCEANIVLAEFLATASPEYSKRVTKGVLYSVEEKKRENNPKYPFTTFLVQDE